MSLAAELEYEHVLIERVAGSLRTFVAHRLAGDGSPDDAARFVTFFRRYVGGYHHEREEQVLFAALARELEVPADRGPIHALTRQHHELAELLARLEHALLGTSSAAARGSARMELDALCTKYVHGLWQHIDAENSVLLPESDARLARVGLARLAARTPNVEENLALDDGVRLALKYPPVHDPTAFRGDGCPACPSFGETCDGIELTWWSDSEWEEAPDRFA